MNYLDMGEVGKRQSAKVLSWKDDWQTPGTARMTIWQENRVEEIFLRNL